RQVPEQCARPFPPFRHLFWQEPPSLNKLRPRFQPGRDRPRDKTGLPSTKETSCGPLSVPSLKRSSNKAISPESKSSISGFTPDSRITFAIRRTLAGVLITTCPPEFMVFRSSVQISGLIFAMWVTHCSGGKSVVPDPATFGSLSEGTNRPPGP